MLVLSSCVVVKTSPLMKFTANLLIGLSGVGMVCSSIGECKVF